MQPRSTNILNSDSCLLTPVFSILTRDSWLLTPLFRLLTPAFRLLTPNKANSGFTLIEVLLATILLGLTASGIGALHFSGLKALSVQDDGMLLDSRIVSRMEYLLSLPFDQINDGSEAVTVNGTGYTITWTAPPVDLDGDTNPESGAKQVTVTVTGGTDKSLTVIVVHNTGRVGKI